MSAQIAIARRYCGPPDSGNGGYACGLVADFLGGGDVEVRLVAPPPLEQPLALERAGAEARMLAGETVVATARATGAPVLMPADAPPPVPYEAAVRAAAAFDVDEYRAGHEYPGCFTCGPDRDVGEGLRIFPAATHRPDLVVWPWIPDPSLFADTGELAAPVLWAALDCPSGQAWIRQQPGTGPVVLGTMAATISRTPSRGERLVVAGWTGLPQGRRRPARSAIYSETGDVLATAAATWVVLTDAQRRSFRTSTRDRRR